MSVLEAMGRFVRCATLCFTVLIFFLSPARVLAGLDGDPALLRMVAEGYRANRDKLTTWQGTASRTSYESGASFRKYFDSRTIQTSVSFAWDKEVDANRWNVSRTATTTIKDGLEDVNHARRFYGGIKKDGLVYKLGPLLDEKGRQPSMCYVYDLQSENALTDVDFRPTMYFSYHGMDIYKTCMAFAGWADNPKVTSRVTRDGDIVTLHVGSDKQFNEYVFDISKGYNLIRWQSVTGPNDQGMTTIEYEEISGVFVPSEYTEHSCTPGADGTNTIKVEVVFENSVLNAPIDPREFTLEAIEVMSGDTIYDYRTGTRYKYGNQGESILEPAIAAVDLEDVIVDVDEFKPEAAAVPVPQFKSTDIAAKEPVGDPEEIPIPDQSGLTSLRIAVAVVLVVFVVLAVLLLSKRRKGKEVGR